jgi:ribose-phosphate pyrophosphokinase
MKRVQEPRHDSGDERGAFQLYGDLVLCSGTANLQLAEEIATYLGRRLCTREVTQFANQNTFVRLEQSVRGSDVFWIQPTAPPTNDNLMELLIAIDTLRRDSAGRITAVVPYYGYGRTDKKDQPRVPITARLVADMLTVAGCDRLLTMDLHAAQIQGFFSIPVDDITAQHMLADYVRKMDLANAVAVAPDIGRAKDARNFAMEVDVPLAIVEKRRSRDGSRTEVLNLIGEVEGKDVLIIDDEIDTAGTMCRAARFVVEQGAVSVYALATHGIFSPPSIQRMADSPFREIVVTNSVHVGPDKELDNLTVLSVGPLLGEVIRRIHLGLSVGAMFNE